VEVGAIWSILAVIARQRIRVEVEIVRIAPGKNARLVAHCAMLPNRKEIPFLVSALAKGSRGARVVRHADGSEPSKPKLPIVPDNLENNATASDFRRSAPPKGLSSASPRAEQAWKMRFEQGMSIKDVAKHLGVAPSRVSSMCRSVREKREDERSLVGLGRTGT